MVSKITPREHLDEVLASYSQCTDDRLLEIMSVLSTHLLSFVEETKLTRDEWMRAIQFLTATGQKCDDVRQEFILLSDVLVCRCWSR